MKSHHLIFSLAFAAILSGCDDTPKEIRLNKMKLQDICNELTETNNDGRVYEAIIGNFLKDKNMTYVEESVGPAEFWTKFSLSNIGQEVVIYSKKMTGDELYNEHISFLEKEVHVHLEEPNFENYIFGICAYKDEEGKYMNQIDTLTFLGEDGGK